MSLETVAATPIVERLVGCIWNSSARRANYLTQFEENYNSLMINMRELRGLVDHVKRRVEVDEASQQMKRTPLVVQWLERVESFQQDVDVISQECSREIEERCCGDYCPTNWPSRYRLGKKVSRKLKIVAELCSQGNFDVVADKSLPAQVQVQPEGLNVGMEEIYGEVLSWLADDTVKIIGIYGMGGVGKTTLLKKINNKFQDEKASKFDMIIWVVVSNHFSLQNIQKQIGKRLGLTWTEDEDQNDRAHHLFDVLSKRRFLLLLDDVWKHMDLEAIGIPSPHLSGNNSKIVITTRSERVCGEMEASKRLRVPVLGWEQAWELFQQKVGQGDLNSHSEIRGLAEAVAKECGGLPLALITTGRAMAAKKTLREWSHARSMLRQYSSEFPGMKEKVLAILKFSYDSLEDDTARECFLDFSLYPEDHNVYIDDLLYHWIGEGFLAESKDLYAALDKGHDIIGSLKAACLLESSSYGENFVKMHDIVRELALWIACECGAKKNKYLVQAGVGLTQAPKVEEWKEAVRISLMENEIEELTGSPECPSLLTLLLMDNYSLSIIPDDFFQYMHILKVLDLSFTGIWDVPKSIGGLVELEFLCLAYTNIRTLPDELKNLVKLKYLCLAATENLKTVPHGMLSCFPRLQVLYLGNIKFDASVEEDLEALEQLGDLGICIQELPTLYRALQRLSLKILWLQIERCQGLIELALMSSTILMKTRRIRFLTLKNCSDLEKLTINLLEAENDDMGSLLTLQELRLYNLPKLSNVLWEDSATHLYFKNLWLVKISYCHELKDLSWLVLVPFLRQLEVTDCKEVEEIIPHRLATTAFENKNVFSRVQSMVFSNLPKLKIITGVALPFPCLELLHVRGCPLLKKLPFAPDNINESALPQIRGYAEWWNELEWEDETIKSFMQPGFIKL
ncbi:mitogen-activated protein kinase kinase [Ranunculus cassubicifolius]